MCTRGSVDSMQLTRDSVTSGLRMPKWFTANGDTQTGNADLSNLDDDRSVSSLRRMMTRTNRMMRMRWMRIVDVVMGVVDIVMGVVKTVMGIVVIMMGVVKAVM